MKALRKDCNTSPHDKRMRQIGRFAGPPAGSIERKMLVDFMSKTLNDDDRERIKRMYHGAKNCCLTQVENGAGFPMDELLRYFLGEYNDRNFEHGLVVMPSSFNVMEAFFQFVPDYLVFKLLDEQDHLFSFVEFLDFVTSPDYNEDVKEAIDYIEDGIVYSYNIVNDLTDFTFLVESGSEFVVAGVSIVRHGNEITVVLLAGEKVDTVKTTKDMLDFTQISGEVPPGKEVIKPSSDRIREAVPLLGNKEFWQVLAITRFDLDTMTLDVRYLMKDAGNSFINLTDDVSNFMSPNGNFLKPEFEVFAKKLADQVENYSAMFEMCKTVLFLPAYFEYHDDLIVEERHKTNFGEMDKKDRLKLKNKILGQDGRIKYRSVSVLRREIGRQPSNTLYSTPDIKVEASGYWEKLPINHIGADKSGRPIHGRTWVEKTLTWIDTEEDAGKLLFKRSTIEHADQTTHNSARGFIYVMRSGAHGKDIFKVGLTTRTSELRSDELSRTTSSPDKFMVMQDWEVSDCQKAERLIHERLSEFRVNPAREFFKAPYRVIFKVIDQVISEIEGHSG